MRKSLSWQRGGILTVVLALFTLPLLPIGSVSAATNCNIPSGVYWSTSTPGAAYDFPTNSDGYAFIAQNDTDNQSGSTQDQWAYTQNGPDWGTCQYQPGSGGRGYYVAESFPNIGYQDFNEPSIAQLTRYHASAAEPNIPSDSNANWASMFDVFLNGYCSQLSPCANVDQVQVWNWRYNQTPLGSKIASQIPFTYGTTTLFYDIYKSGSQGSYLTYTFDPTSETQNLLTVPLKSMLNWLVNNDSLSGSLPVFTTLFGIAVGNTDNQALSWRVNNFSVVEN